MQIDIPDFPDVPEFPFNPFAMFDIFFIIVPVFIFIVFIIIAVTACRATKQSTAMFKDGGFVVRPPSFVIPEQHREETRVDGSQYKTVRLPNKCPNCGASLSQEGIDWVGPLEARCQYCGSTVKARFESV